MRKDSSQVWRDGRRTGFEVSVSTDDRNDDEPACSRQNATPVGNQAMYKGEDCFQYPEKSISFTIHTRHVRRFTWIIAGW